MAAYLGELSIFRGERKTWVGIVKNSAGVVVDITGAALYFTVRSDYPAGTITDDDDGDVLLKKTVGAGISLSDPTNGEFNILVEKADTNTIEINKGGKGYLYEISVVESGQSEPRVLALGPFTLLSDVVRGV